MTTKSNLWTAVIVLLAGVLLICIYPIAADIIVQVLGGMFLLAAILNLSMLFGTKAGKSSKSGNMTAILTAIASGVLGLWMLIDPQSLVSLLVYLIAAVIIVAGVYQVCTLLFAFRPIRFPFGFFVLPMLLIIGGIAMIFLGPQKVSSGLALIVGIVMIVYAISLFIEVYGVYSFNKALSNGKKVDYIRSDNHGNTIEVKAEEIKPSDND